MSDGWGAPTATVQPRPGSVRRSTRIGIGPRHGAATRPSRDETLDIRYDAKCDTAQPSASFCDTFSWVLLRGGIGSGLEAGDENLRTLFCRLLLSA